MKRPLLWAGSLLVGPVVGLVVIGAARLLFWACGLHFEEYAYGVLATATSFAVPAGVGSIIAMAVTEAES